MIDANKSVVFFDGVCVLCNASVQFILKRDGKQYFYFATLQSDVAKQFLLHVPENILKKDSIILWDKGKIYTESAAALKIGVHLNGFWKASQVLWIVPPFIRDWVYRWIAKNRYKWFGVKDQCMMPDQNIKHRFLD